MSQQRTAAPACVKRGCEVSVNEAPWGSLQWMVSRQNGASRAMTVGRVTIKPGMGNPTHQHPNCEEVLYVLQGELEHTLPDGGTVRLGAGDCIVLEPGIFHRAVNVGCETAIVLVAFNNADRQTVTQGEGTEE